MVFGRVNTVVVKASKPAPLAPLTPSVSGVVPGRTPATTGFHRVPFIHFEIVFFYLFGRHLGLLRLFYSLFFLFLALRQPTLNEIVG